MDTDEDFGWDDVVGDDGEDCWYCMGAGGVHDCGEDCCCCADPDEVTEDCPECGGTGFLR